MPIQISTEDVTNFITQNHTYTRPQDSYLNTRADFFKAHAQALCDVINPFLAAYDSRKEYLKDCAGRSQYNSFNTDFVDFVQTDTVVPHTDAPINTLLKNSIMREILSDLIVTKDALKPSFEAEIEPLLRVQVEHATAIQDVRLLGGRQLLSQMEYFLIINTELSFLRWLDIHMNATRPDGSFDTADFNHSIS